MLRIFTILVNSLPNVAAILQTFPNTVMERRSLCNLEGLGLFSVVAALLATHVPNGWLATPPTTQHESEGIRVI
jgi:hypothetical protein